MIELRWIDKPFGKLIHPITGEIQELPKQRVLQYRLRQNLGEIGLRPPIYGDWIDVPVVKEGE